MAYEEKDTRIYGSDPTEEQLGIVEDFIRQIKETNEYNKHADEAEEYLTVQLAHRFLCARDYNIKKSFKLLTKHLEWRFETYRPFEIKAADVEVYARKGAVQSNSHGPDQFGRPIMILDDTKENVEIKNAKEKQREGMKHLVFHMERCFAHFENGVRRYVVFINLSDFSIMKAPPLSTARETIGILGSQYPETLGLAVLYKAPWVFKKFFDAVKVFIDKNTRQKILFITGDTKDGSANDKKLKELMGEDWKKMVGVDQPRGDKKISHGYNHETFWPTVVEWEQKRQN